MPPPPPAEETLLRVRGTVQGVGFRPFVHRTARRLGLRGWVRNDADGVLIKLDGTAERIARFRRALHDEAPPAARVVGIEPAAASAADAPAGPDFAILPSPVAAGPCTVAVPADLALCADCRRELLDPADRRHAYPFINCTQCGPRYSLIEALPYDRARTSMRAFPLCPACAREYADPTDRRFHAEPNACPTCGPHLTLTDPAGAHLATRAAALDLAAAALRAGRIVAVKGVGGFHLMCDATNDATVAELRRRKHREEKPLAVMFPDFASLGRHAVVSAAAAALLASPAAPIVLLPRRADRPLAPTVAPGNPWIGALLPSAPLHVLLLAAVGRPVVATSANLSEEPLCTDNDEARIRLAGLADLHLTHDRGITRPVDDSVVRLTTAGHPILLRRARGHAPAPLALPRALPGVLLCTGAGMKSTIAVAADRQVVLSPHLGDLGNAATQRAFADTVAMLGTLHGRAPTLAVHDKHPDYPSTRFAVRGGLPRLAVQHHLAHVLACLLEHGHPADDVLGLACDGTGYGEDGTVWGGEFILLRQHRAERFGRLRPFRLPGSEAAVRDPRRVALALLTDLAPAAVLARHLGFSEADGHALTLMARSGLNSPLCSSLGRLFDGVSALLGLCAHNSFEGQAPLCLEAAASHAPADAAALPFAVTPATAPGARYELDWRPALAALWPAPADAAASAAGFHRGLAQAFTTLARHAGARTVALTGGCFQNALLLDHAVAALTAAGFHVLTHRLLPPNDNAIAAGQALAALLGLTTVHAPDGAMPAA